jgi:outer membrane protein insertion porin family
MFGIGVNSEAGVTGQFVIDERNFDITRIPTSFDDFVNGSAFRGAGQGFRLEALPGDQVQRYLVSFTEPYLLDSLISLNVSAFYYDRLFIDWSEQRLGGRVALGRWLNPNLSVSAALRAEQVKIYNPRVAGVPELDAVVGDSDLFSGRFTVTHDTRDVPFAPTEGRLLELSYEQVFGDFDYPRGEIDWRRYFLLRERPDGSGRHTLSTSMRLGFSGSQTPLFENYFAGGFSTMRGFNFRGASPVSGGVIVGGEFRMLGSVEYIFPLTADDMFKGALFVDYGTVEEKIELNSDDFRVAPGLGLRINVPMLGPAPLAFDFAFPVAREDSDQIQIFSFFFGFGR